jgi:hypothetical protein
LGSVVARFMQKRQQSRLQPPTSDHG